MAQMMYAEQMALGELQIKYMDRVLGANSLDELHMLCKELSEEPVTRHYDWRWRVDAEQKTIVLDTAHKNP